VFSVLCHGTGCAAAALFAVLCCAVLCCIVLCCIAVVLVAVMSPEGVVAFTPPSLVIYNYKLQSGHIIHTELLAVPAGPGR